MSRTVRITKAGQIRLRQHKVSPALVYNRERDKRAPERQARQEQPQ